MKGVLLLFVILGTITTATSQCLLKNLLDCANYLGSSKFTEFTEKAYIWKEFVYGNADKTLILPSSIALDNIPESVLADMDNNITFMRSVLRYHLVPQKLECSNIKDNSLVNTTQGTQVRFNWYQSKQGKISMTVEGANYLNVEKRAFNGKICVVDQVLYKVPLQSAYEYVSADRALSTFLLLAAKSQSLDSFKGPDITLLIPDNNAFSKLPPGVLQSISSNATLLKEVISNHMANSVLFANGLEITETYKASSGSVYPVTIKDGGVYIGSSKVINADIPTFNGVVHIIDSVLLDVSEL